jgi:putative copper resistance protein D
MSERFLSSRPIQATGWAFFLLIMMLGVMAGPAIAQHANALREASHETAHDHGGTVTPGVPQWEGSLEGIAYSEFNHHLAGIFILLIGLTELWEALGIGLLAWSRFLLPVAMLGVGGYLLIWSDHEAWPVGSLSFAQTLFGGDWEMLQHKIYALLSLSVGAIEGLRWVDHRLRHALWTIPFPAFAIIGGFMLFLHDHGIHPSAHKIALDHAIMGTMAVAAGFCKLVSARTSTVTPSARPSRWDLAWASFIVLIGLQLLFYTE